MTRRVQVYVTLVRELHAARNRAGSLSPEVEANLVTRCQAIWEAMTKEEQDEAEKLVIEAKG